MTFEELAAAHRRELHLHCYRIVGSVQDAEDLVQETLLAAWRGLDGFEERSSMRTWLYRIATNRCLNALRDRGRRPAVAGPPPPEPTRRIEPVWLEPYPDPEARYEAREAIGLAYITALQRLPPRQRAVLVLRDVLGFRGAEVADMLGLSEAAVASALHRARSAVPPEPDSVPAGPGLLDAFVDAFESGDVDRVVALLSSDARLTMSPAPLEYEGPEGRSAVPRNRPRGRPDRADPTGAHARQRPAGVRAPPARSRRAGRTCVRADGADRGRGPDHGDHGLHRHRRVRRLRAPADDRYLTPSTM